MVEYTIAHATIALLIIAVVGGVGSTVITDAESDILGIWGEDQEEDVGFEPYEPELTQSENVVVDNVMYFKEGVEIFERISSDIVSNENQVDSITGAGFSSPVSTQDLPSDINGYTIYDLISETKNYYSDIEDPNYKDINNPCTDYLDSGNPSFKLSIDNSDEENSNQDTLNTYFCGAFELDNKDDFPDYIKYEKDDNKLTIPVSHSPFSELFLNYQNILPNEGPRTDAGQWSTGDMSHLFSESPLNEINLVFQVEDYSGDMTHIIVPFDTDPEDFEFFYFEDTELEYSIAPLVFNGGFTIPYFYLPEPCYDGDGEFEDECLGQSSGFLGSFRDYLNQNYNYPSYLFYYDSFPESEEAHWDFDEGTSFFWDIMFSDLSYIYDSISSLFLTEDDENFETDGDIFNHLDESYREGGILYMMGYHGNTSRIVLNYILEITKDNKKDMMEDFLRGDIHNAWNNAPDRIMKNLFLDFFTIEEENELRDNTISIIERSVYSDYVDNVLMLLDIEPKVTGFNNQVSDFLDQSDSKYILEDKLMEEYSESKSNFYLSTLEQMGSSNFFDAFSSIDHKILLLKNYENKNYNKKDFNLNSYLNDLSRTKSDDVIESTLKFSSIPINEDLENFIKEVGLERFHSSLENYFSSGNNWDDFFKSFTGKNFNSFDNFIYQYPYSEISSFSESELASLGIFFIIGTEKYQYKYFRDFLYNNQLEEDLYLASAQSGNNYASFEIDSPLFIDKGGENVPQNFHLISPCLTNIDLTYDKTYYEIGSNVIYFHDGVLRLSDSLESEIKEDLLCEKEFIFDPYFDLEKDDRDDLNNYLFDQYFNDDKNLFFEMIFESDFFDKNSIFEFYDNLYEECLNDLYCHFFLDAYHLDEVAGEILFQFFSGFHNFGDSFQFYPIFGNKTDGVWNFNFESTFDEGHHSYSSAKGDFFITSDNIPAFLFPIALRHRYPQSDNLNDAIDSAFNEFNKLKQIEGECSEIISLVDEYFYYDFYTKIRGKTSVYDYYYSSGSHNFIDSEYPENSFYDYFYVNEYTSSEINDFNEILSEDHIQKWLNDRIGKFKYDSTKENFMCIEYVEEYISNKVDNILELKESSSCNEEVNLNTGESISSRISTSERNNIIMPNEPCFNDLFHLENILSTSYLPFVIDSLYYGKSNIDKNNRYNEFIEELILPTVYIDEIRRNHQSISTSDENYKEKNPELNTYLKPFSFFFQFLYQDVDDNLIVSDLDDKINNLCSVPGSCNYEELDYLNFSELIHENSDNFNTFYSPFRDFLLIPDDFERFNLDFSESDSSDEIYSNLENMFSSKGTMWKDDYFDMISFINQNTDGDSNNLLFDFYEQLYSDCLSNLECSMFLEYYNLDEVVGEILFRYFSDYYRLNEMFISIGSSSYWDNKKLFVTERNIPSFLFPIGLMYRYNTKSLDDALDLAINEFDNEISSDLSCNQIINMVDEYLYVDYFNNRHSSESYYDVFTREGAGIGATGDTLPIHFYQSYSENELFEDLETVDDWFDLLIDDLFNESRPLMFDDFSCLKEVESYVNDTLNKINDKFESSSCNSDLLLSHYESEKIDSDSENLPNNYCLKEIHKLDNFLSSKGLPEMIDKLHKGETLTFNLGQRKSDLKDIMETSLYESMSDNLKGNFLVPFNMFFNFLDNNQDKNSFIDNSCYYPSSDNHNDLFISIISEHIEKECENNFKPESLFDRIYSLNIINENHFDKSYLYDLFSDFDGEICDIPSTGEDFLKEIHQKISDDYNSLHTDFIICDFDYYNFNHDLSKHFQNSFNDYESNFYLDIPYLFFSFLYDEDVLDIDGLKTHDKILSRLFNYDSKSNIRGSDLCEENFLYCFFNEELFGYYYNCSDYSVSDVSQDRSDFVSPSYILSEQLFDPISYDIPLQNVIGRLSSYVDSDDDLDFDQNEFYDIFYKEEQFSTKNNILAESDHMNGFCYGNSFELRKSNVILTQLRSQQIALNVISGAVGFKVGYKFGGFIGGKAGAVAGTGVLPGIGTGVGGAAGTGLGGGLGGGIGSFLFSRSTNLVYDFIIYHHERDRLYWPESGVAS